MIIFGELLVQTVVPLLWDSGVGNKTLRGLNVLK